MNKTYNEILFFSKATKETLMKLAGDAINSKDYKTLKSICLANKYDIFMGLNSMDNSSMKKSVLINYVKFEALKIILEFTTFSNKDKEESAWEKINLLNIKDTNLDEPSGRDDFDEKIIYILKLKLSRGFDLGNYDIMQLNHINHYDALDFINSHKIDLYKTILNTDGSIISQFSPFLKLINYYEVKPDIKIYSKSTGTCLANKFGPILSHTYSDMINSTQIYNIYQTIYNSGHIGEVMMAQFTQYIIHNDKVSIFFSKQEVSQFSCGSKAININLNIATRILLPFNHIISIEAITAHEIMHYLIENIFSMNSLPDNIFKLSKFSIQKNLQENFQENFICNNLSDVLLNPEMDNGNICIRKDIVEFSRKYNDATNDILYKAFDIIKLKTSIKEYTTNIDSLDLALNLQQSHPIFSLLSLNNEHLLENNKIELILNKINNLMNFQEFNNDFNSEVEEIFENLKSRKDEYKSEEGKEILFYKKIIDLLETKYLPKIIDNLKLDQDQAYFLSRVSDLIDRYQDYIIDQSHNINSYNVTNLRYEDKEKEENAFKVEPIVRCIELQIESLFMEINPSILKACKKMDKFMIEYVFKYLDYPEYQKIPDTYIEQAIHNDL